MYTRHLRLKALYNARDLGGYPTLDGKVTRFGVFLRSDAPCDLPEEDIRTLVDYGLTGSMDLRSNGERLARPSSLAEVVDYYPHSLYAEAAIPGAAPSPSPTQTWVERYIEMTTFSQTWAVRALEIAARQPGCLLYHCTTGKDRTGLLTCYLLSIAGVPREDIAADYCISELFLEPVYRRMRAGALPLGGKMAPPPIHGSGGESFFSTPASAMLGLIDYMEANFGGVVGYLRAAGVEEATLQTLRAKLVEG